MGNDGGSIPTRRELVKSASRAPNMSELKATALESLSHAWTHCALTSEALDMENIVSDWRGRLYNYESILRGLMPDRSVAPNKAFETAFTATGIKSLRDIQKLKFKQYAPPGKNKKIWACPVSLKEMGPSTRAVYVVPCGHVFAEIVFKELQEHACPECGDEFKDENLIPIMPTEEVDIHRLFARISNLKEGGLTHTLKKDKAHGKKKRKADDETRDDSEASHINQGDAGKKTRDFDDAAQSSRINNAMAASLTAKVLAEQEEKSKRRRLEDRYKNGQVSRA
jgi:Rtf2 RING-finger